MALAKHNRTPAPSQGFLTDKAIRAFLLWSQLTREEQDDILRQIGEPVA